MFPKLFIVFLIGVFVALTGLFLRQKRVDWATFCLVGVTLCYLILRLG